MSGLDYLGRHVTSRRRGLVGVSGQFLESPDDGPSAATVPREGTWASVPKAGVSLQDAPDLAAVRAGRASLRRGARGDAVTWVQRALARYGAKPDGVFGSETEVAVRKFQEDRGIAVDGVVGKGTMAAIDGNAPPAKDKPSPSSQRTFEYTPPAILPASPPVAERPTNWLAWGAGAVALALGSGAAFAWYEGGR